MNDQILILAVGISLGAALAFFSGFSYLSALREIARRDASKAKGEYETELKRLRIFMADNIGTV